MRRSLNSILVISLIEVAKCLKSADILEVMAFLNVKKNILIKSGILIGLNGLVLSSDFQHQGKKIKAIFQLRFKIRGRSTQRIFIDFAGLFYEKFFHDDFRVPNMTTQPIPIGQ